MSKNIRPLAAFKKQHPKVYAIISLHIEKHTSKKGQENEFYWLYCFCFSDIEVFDGNLNKPPCPFFYKTPNEKNNKGTVTELGRLLLTGWYYGIDDFSKNVAMYVYRAYQRKQDNGEAFNDMEFKDAVLHIRENIGYYYHNPDKLKLYILKTFFKDELKPLLPPMPEALNDHFNAVEFIEEMHKNRLKRDKDWYIKNYNRLEGYVSYLMELLDCCEIPYLSESEHEAKEAADNKAYFDEINEMYKEYNDNMLQSVLTSGERLLT